MTSHDLEGLLPEVARRYGQREERFGPAIWLDRMRAFNRAIWKSFPTGRPQIAQRYPAQEPIRKGWKRRDMLLPKPAYHGRKAVIVGDQDVALARAMGKLAPPERKALAQIVETADLALIEGLGLALVIPSTPQLLDYLAQVGEQFADMERGGEDEDGHDAEDVNEDGDEKGESSADTEPSLGAPEGQMDQTNLARGNVDDREYDPADEGEPDVDDEPSLGSPDGNIDQTRWACGSYDDREHDPADDRQPDEDYEPDLEGMWERPFV